MIPAEALPANYQQTGFKMDLQKKVDELEARVAGLEDLVFSIGGYLREVAASGGADHQLIAGSDIFTDRQRQILDAVTRKIR